MSKPLDFHEDPKATEYRLHVRVISDEGKETMKETIKFSAGTPSPIDIEPILRGQKGRAEICLESMDKSAVGEVLREVNNLAVNFPEPEEPNQDG